MKQKVLEENILGLLEEVTSEAKGPLCAKLRQRGCEFSREEIDFVLDTLSTQGGILLLEDKNEGIRYALLRNKLYEEKTYQ